MGNFQCNSIEDLVFNLSFRKWVLNHPDADVSFWNNWVANNQDKAEIVERSTAIVSALQFNLKGLPEESLDKEISAILQKLPSNNEQLNAAPGEIENLEPGNKDELYNPHLKNRTFASFKRNFIFAAAACISGVIIIASYYLLRGNFVKKEQPNYESFIAGSAEGIAQIENNSDSTQLVILPDGSKVHLEKNSRLRYTNKINGSKREVFLAGAAFFDVKKNPSHPFIVYTSSIITKVLGTSFRVKAYPSDINAMITVRTGKVSVFKKSNFDDEAANGKTLGGLVLTPNQEVIYTGDSNELNKKIAEQPQVIEAPSKKAFVFEATPVAQVFKIMQDTYNITIVYDEDIMAGCSLSASMGNEPFYDKLNLICKAINASYEMIDGQIIIMSKGCKPHSVNK